VSGCVYCGTEPTQPFSPDYEFPVCRSCGIRQHEALSEIAQMVRPMKLGGQEPTSTTRQVSLEEAVS
jgi:hypothetical protein